MQDLIQQIIEMDRKAQTITASAQKEKIDSEHETAERRKEIRKRAMDRAKTRIAAIEPQERSASDAAWKQKEKNNEELMQKMNDLYAKKGEQWVSEIVNHVLVGGTS